ncbi:MAG: hypothetical protein AAFV43_08905 [Planctomycetota bacterium]
MHTIRLRNAWEEVEAGVHRRRFHRPTGLDDSCRVFLATDEGDSEGDLSLNDLSLNDQRLGDPPRYDVTRLLLPSNELVVRGGSETLRSSMRLEIETIAAGS